MRFYKMYEKEYIGTSDIARLVLSSPQGAYALDFNCDGVYEAYICDRFLNPCGFEHYTKVYECTGWLKVYDDFEKTFEIEGEEIVVYRAGDFGCIIHVAKEGKHRGGSGKAAGYIDKLDKLIKSIVKLSGACYVFNIDNGCREFHYQEETISFYDHCICGGTCEDTDVLHYSDRARAYNEILAFYSQVYNKEDLI